MTISRVGHWNDRIDPIIGRKETVCFPSADHALGLVDSAQVGAINEVWREVELG